jgi:tetratricopeptide (TPR) repeat protein
MILGIIIIGLILIITDKPNNPNLPPAIAILVVPLVIAVLADRLPRFQSMLQRLYSLFFFGFMGLGVVSIVIFAIRGELPLTTFWIILIPLVALVGSFFIIFYLGPILFKIGKPKAALNLYSFLIRINSKFGYGYLQRGILRHAQRDTDNALMDYDQALKLAKIKAASRQPQYFSINYSAASIYGNKADIYLYKNDPQQAILECNMGLSLHENQPAINLLLQYRRGYAQLVTGNYDGALQDLNTLHFEGKTAAHAKSFAPNINALKAISLAGLGRIDEAKSFWAKAVAANPDFNKSEWLRTTRLWPSNLISLAEQLG